MATYSSILDWRIPWTEEPSGHMGSQRGGPDTTQKQSSRKPRETQIIRAPRSTSPSPGSTAAACPVGTGSLPTLASGNRSQRPLFDDGDTVL